MRPDAPPGPEPTPSGSARRLARPHTFADGALPRPEPAAIPMFPVALEAPSLADWRQGNTGIPGFTTASASTSGPHVVVIGLLHGNEVAGAVVLDRMLRAGLAPATGRLTVGFANLAAYDRFDPASPTASRFVDEDMNRVWDTAVLDGPRQSIELARARAIRPIVESADLLLDLHSMLWPSEPLILCGPSAQGRRLALSLGTPPLVVADHGHQTGPRLIDHPRFTDPDTGAAACLVEAGQHWQPATVEVMQDTIDALLQHAGLARMPRQPHPAPRFAQVVQAITAATAGFAFVRPWRGGDVVPHRNTLIALDGAAEIRTPHDDCLLVMPSLRASRGHTAVRLARFEDPSPEPPGAEPA